ncbi:MAG: hypothetical protein ACQESR_28745, partial [Planctomycetota bacterium]
VNFADSESKSVSHANRRAWRPVLLQSLCNCRVYKLNRRTGKVRQLTFEQDSDWSPTALPNGRVPKAPA